MKKLKYFLNKKRHIELNLSMFKININFTNTWLIKYVCKIILAICIAFLMVELIYK